MDIINSFVDGTVTFSSLGEWFKGIFEPATAEGSVFADYFGMAKDFIEGMVPALWMISAVLAVLSLVQVFAGKKLLGFQKFLGCFGLGFILGSAYVTPLVADLGVELDALIVGLVVGVIAALLCKLVYFLAYVLAAGASVYVLCISGAIEALAEMTEGNMVIAIVAAVVAIVLALLLRKIIETLGTAALGGWTLVLSIEAVVAGFMPEFSHFESWLFYAIMGVAAFIGFIVQIKTRRRY